MGRNGGYLRHWHPQTLPLTPGAFGRSGTKEVEYQYKDVYQKKSKRTGETLTGKTIVNY